MRGLITIDRSVFESVVFKDEPYTEVQAWIWMIAEASYKKRDVKSKRGVIHLERGQLTSSTRFMANKWQWKEPRVRRFLKRLKNNATIDVLSDATQNIITICNYTKYQELGCYIDNKDNVKKDAVATQQRRSNDANKNTRIIPEEIPEEIPDDFLSNLNREEKKYLRDVLSAAQIHLGNGSLKKWQAAAIEVVKYWMSKGVDLDKCAVPKIEEMVYGKLQSGQKLPKSMNYYKAAVIEASNKANPGAYKIDDNSERWRAKVKIWLKTGMWMTQWGAPPEKAGTLVPVNILAEMGVGR